MIWIGILKFTTYEAEGIKPLVANSPLSWAYGITSVQSFANLLGVVEITLGLLIAFRSVSARVSAVGSFGAILVFFLTLTFIFSTPGIWKPEYVFPSHARRVHCKRPFIFWASVWSAGEALNYRDLIEFLCKGIHLW